MTRQRVVVALALLILLVAIAIVRWRKTSSDGLHTIAAAAKPLGSSCASAATLPTIGARLRLVVFRGPGVSDGDVTDQLARAASYYQPYGLELARFGDVQALDDRFMMAGSREQLERELQDAGIDPSVPARGQQVTLARRITCNVALGPLTKMLHRHAGHAGGGVVNLLVLQRIAEPGSPLASLLTNLRGVTFEPHNMSQELRACLAIEGHFTPTILLGLDAIDARRPGTVDLTLAHELGHVAGLEHNSRPSDLMAVEPPRCVPALTAEQVTGWIGALRR